MHWLQQQLSSPPVYWKVQTYGSMSSFFLPPVNVWVQPQKDTRKTREWLRKADKGRRVWELAQWAEEVHEEWRMLLDLRCACDCPLIYGTVHRRPNSMQQSNDATEEAGAHNFANSPVTQIPAGIFRVVPSVFCCCEMRFSKLLEIAAAKSPRQAFQNSGCSEVRRKGRIARVERCRDGEMQQATS